MLHNVDDYTKKSTVNHIILFTFLWNYIKLYEFRKGVKSKKILFLAQQKLC